MIRMKVIILAIFGLMGVTSFAYAQTSLFQEAPVMEAVKGKDVSGLRELLLRGENPNVTDRSGTSALMHAVVLKHSQIVQSLVDHNAQLELEDNLGQRALYRAAQDGSIDIMETLLEKGAEIDPVNTEGMTPLMAAAKNGHYQAAKMLLDHGADVYIADYTGRDALDWARDGRSTNLVSLIESKQ